MNYKLKHVFKHGKPLHEKKNLVKWCIIRASWKLCSPKLQRTLPWFSL